MSRPPTSPLGEETELRLTAIHLRLGSLLLARAELESLAARGLLNADGLADLAELRWRAGDLEGAGAMAAAHLASGGNRPIARVVLAESDAVAGRMDEAANHVETLGDVGASAFASLFAGMPLRGPWPIIGSGPLTGMPGDAAALGAEEPGADPGAAGKAPAALPEAGEVLARAGVDLRSRDRLRHVAGIDRLALVLRLDPRLAEEVVETLGRRREPAAHLVRGDALRIMGRGYEAEVAYGAAAAALDSGTGQPS
ncbi:MAG: hypothetical protein ABI598_07625 [Chloroflexota bacterium]